MSPMIRLPLTTAHALLGFLHRRPMHGYEIHQQLSDPTGLGLVWRLKQSRLYALLGKLEEEGYVRASLEPQEARPPRKIFELTGEGRSAFLEWVESPVLHGRELRLDFMAKLYFAMQEGPDVACQLIERQRAVCDAWKAEQLAQVDRLPESQPYEQLVHQFRVGQIESMIAWLDLCEETALASGSAPGPIMAAREAGVDDRGT